jgi:hypothetical protein
MPENQHEPESAASTSEGSSGVSQRGVIVQFRNALLSQGDGRNGLRSSIRCYPKAVEAMVRGRQSFANQRRLKNGPKSSSRCDKKAIEAMVRVYQSVAIQISD